MRFAAEEWLWGMLLALVVGGLFVWGGVRVHRARIAFGDEERIERLVTGKTATRRTLSALLRCAAVALAFLAAAGPQFGQGTRVLPATNLDVVLVLDYSKSMYARDVAPSRIERAKIEVSRLVKKLGGARFGAVAFAGEPLSFPLTSDGAAIAQFFRGLDPGDMPVGGTASARALVAAQELFARDPRSEQHEKVIVLVTDGEDLEGDPVQVATEVAGSGIRIEVVQIGGRSPEPIPQYDEKGAQTGMRTDAQGNLLTTALTAQGEEQLKSIASAGRGKLHQAQQGEIGIDAIGDELRSLMTEELSERVETVYADVFHYPLGLAVLLLIIEAFVGTGSVRRQPSLPARGQRQKRLPRRLRATAVLLACGSLGCQQVDKLFERKSPIVNEAIDHLNGARVDEAVELLTKYLETGACEAGVIGAGDRARKLGDAAFDLGLAFGKSGTETPGASAASGLVLPPGVGTAAQSPDPLSAAAPGNGAGSKGKAGDKTPLIECALRLLGPLAESSEHDPALRARALYLMGNLEAARESYRAAVSAYDRGLLFAPGFADASLGDPIGRDLAHNRAFALRRAIEEEQKKKEQEKDQPKDPQQKKDQQNDDSKDGEQKPDPSADPKDEADSSKGEQPKDEPQAKDKGQQEQQANKGPDGTDKSADATKANGEPTPSEARDGEQDKAATASAARHGPSVSQDERMLDLLEQAPTLQQAQAKQRANVRAGRRQTMEDK